MKDLKTFTRLIKENSMFSSINSSFLQKEIRTIVDQKNETQEILNSLIEGIIVFNNNLQVTYFNSFAKKFFKGLEKGIFLKENTFKEFFKICREVIDLCIKNKKVIKKSAFLKDQYFDVLGILKKDRVILIFQDRTLDYKIFRVGKDFVANASHELKTPITIIRGFAETLKDVPKLSVDIMKKIAKKIIKTSIKLENLIKDLLMLEQIEHTNLQFSVCDIKKIFYDVKNALLSIYPDAKIFIRASGSMLVLAERDLLELAFRNLLENSIKYSERIPKIFITLEKKDKKIKCSIKDNGIGISSENLKNVFDRFFRENKTKTKSTGLGLSIVKNIIQKHKGVIEVFSKEKKGTTFEIFFKRFCY